MSETAGFWMLGAVAALLVATGLPVFVVLVGTAVAFALGGLAAGLLEWRFLSALPARIVGLLDNDLLQALPLYVLMGALLDRLPLADLLYRAANAFFARTRAAPLLSAIGLGALLAPMNGSVGASVAMLSHTVQPRLLASGAPPAKSLAVVCAAATLGVVVPPSLVLILLGDAMLRAHTEAVNTTHVAVRIINTQDVFRGAIVPAALFLALCFAIAWWSGRRDAAEPRARLAVRDAATAVLTLALVGGLLAAVAAGRLYAVEAAASGGFALFIFGLVSGQLTRAALSDILARTMAVSGALFALFVAATTFTLVFRGFGTDRLLETLIASLPGGAAGAIAALLVALALCALVLDAFEIIFVVVPLVMPAVLVRVPDAVWVATLTLLALQASFLVPPLGYAVMMARSALPRPVSTAAAARALAPFLGAQLLVLAAVLAAPRLVHLAEPAEAATQQPLSDDEVKRLFDNLVPPPDD